MSPSRLTRRPLSLQARLLAAVIGFVSLILVIVAIITSATLGSTLEARLDDQLRTTATNARYWVADASVVNPAEMTSRSVLTQKQVPPGMLLVLSVPTTGVTGSVVQGNVDVLKLSKAQLDEVARAIQDTSRTTTTISGVGSYRLDVQHFDNGISIVTGLPRSDILQTMATLFTVIALATLGGLILLALTTTITIGVSLRPLRAVAATATRVANQPLAQGAVSIVERVPAAQADPLTETGLVGAALNKLLDHVDESLSARQRNEERMRQFVADASHELRTPLASIRGYSELSLRDPSLPETTQMAMERIQAQSLRMTHLVEDLLLLARLDEGMELVRGTTDLSRLVVECVTDARPTAPDHHWNIDLPDEPVLITGDTARLNQVLVNLLANARTHTPTGTHITVRVALDGDDTATVTVHDDGPGLAPERREALFGRFARGDDSRARQTGGTGLGLAIAKAIVDGHGGSIEVTSEPGDTSFTVRLPVTPPASILERPERERQ